jgi:hypothetical protein
VSEHRLTLPQAARVLNHNSERYLRSLIKTGKLAADFVNGRYLIDPAEIECYRDRVSRKKTSKSYSPATSSADELFPVLKR